MEKEKKRSTFLRLWEIAAGFLRRLSENVRFDDWRKLGGYYLAIYLVAVAVTALFLTEVTRWDLWTRLVMLTALPVYALIYTLPGVFLSLLASFAAVKFRRARIVVMAAVAALGSGVTQLFLLADFGLLHNFHYHFDPFVWNLLTTPGGFRSMGLRGGAIALMALVILAGVAFHFALAYWLCLFRGGAAALRLYRILLRGWRKFALFALAFLVFLTNAVVFAWCFYMKYPAPLLAASRIPAYQRVTMRDVFRGLGIREPSREELLVRVSNRADLNYPAAPIRRRPVAKKYNVVWLVCESWRADMLTPELMPRTCDFAAKHGIRFTRNFSGGNGTRMGVFSMFYGLYGSYWHSFLASRRGALLIDWMIDDGYDIRCFTSAKFSYPEFDHTVFARLPESALCSDDYGETYVRDIRNIRRFLDFVTRDRQGRPFMAFMFFESTHHPYEFPPENAICKPFVDKVDYLQLSRDQAEGIKNRYRNCCRTLDGFLGQVFDTLEKRGLLENSIVVLLGDHGEEFFERGTLGHGQEFTNEQTRTPLILHLPDRKPAVYDGLSSHLDIPAMLAPYFGVENPASDYSNGMNLLGPGAPKRRYVLLAKWNGVFFVGEKYKMPLPLSSYESITGKAYDMDDREISGPKVVYDSCRDQLLEIRRDLLRFMK